MNEVVSLYRDYVSHPTIEGFKHFFHSVVESSCDVSDELLDYYFHASPVYDSEHKRLISNGTSSMRKEDREYWFGPLFNPVREIVENFIRTRTFDPYFRLILSTNFPVSKNESFEVGRVHVDISDYNYGYRLIDEIEKQKDKDKIFCLYSFPNNIHSFGYLPYLVDYFCNQKNFIISSSNREAFFDDTLLIRRGIVVNDNMVNWRSGVSFYTCQFGKRHGLRNIYGKRNGRYYNLININCKEGTPIDDLVYYSKESCPCGRSFVLEDIIPHYEFCPKRNDGSFIFDLSLARKIKHQWYTVQFVENDGKLDCHYTSENRLDQDMIENELRTSIRLVPDSSFFVGTLSVKSFVFWNRQDLIKLTPWTR